MNREILFKAKRKDNGEWIEGDFTHTEDGRVGIEYTHKFFASGTKSRITMLVAPETVCQYTGLKDKNGRKIFEGDIISYYTTKGIADQKKSVGEIEFSDGAFSVKHGHLWRFLYFDNYKVEVIGNIFDNPELIGVQIK